MTREKDGHSRRLEVLHILIDFLQLWAFILQPRIWNSPGAAQRIEHLPLTPAVVDWLWKYVQWFQFQNPIVGLGYRVYTILFSILVVLISLSIGICYWLGHSFSTKRFPFVWPIK